MLPGTINLATISHSGNTLTISGRSLNNEGEILAYARSLSASGRFTETIITGIKRIDDGGMDFTLVLKSKG